MLTGSQPKRGLIAVNIQVKHPGQQFHKLVDRWRVAVFAVTDIQVQIRQFDIQRTDDGGVHGQRGNVARQNGTTQAHANRVDIEQDVVGFLHNVKFNAIGLGKV